MPIKWSILNFWFVGMSFVPMSSGVLNLRYCIFNGWCA